MTSQRVVLLLTLAAGSAILIPPWQTRETPARFVSYAPIFFPPVYTAYVDDAPTTGELTSAVEATSQVPTMREPPSGLTAEESESWRRRERVIMQMRGRSGVGASAPVVTATYHDASAAIAWGILATELLSLGLLASIAIAWRRPNP